MGNAVLALDNIRNRKSQSFVPFIGGLALTLGLSQIGRFGYWSLVGLFLDVGCLGSITIWAFGKLVRQTRSLQTSPDDKDDALDKPSKRA